MSKNFKQLIEEIKATEAKLVELKKAAKELLATSDNSIDKDEYTELLASSGEAIQEGSSKVGRWSYFFETSEMKWSDEVYKIYECQHNFDGRIVDFFISCLSEKAIAQFPEQAKKIRESREQLIFNQFVTTPKGNIKYLSLSSMPIVNDKDEIIGVEGLVKDISDEISGKNGLDNFFNLSHDLHCIVDADGYFVKISPAWTRLLGYAKEEMISRPFLDFVHPEDVEITIIKEREQHEKGNLASYENRYLTKSGEIVYLNWNSQVDPETKLSFCTARDVTKSRLTQDELLSDLSVKDLQLRETHHRVKNNLQIITSLLSLQAGANSGHAQLAELYEDSQNRIKSMAAIHEMFYQSKELDKIEFGEYLDKLIGDLSRSITSSERTIDLTLNVKSVFVNLDTAIPLGLLINEIVTNAIKYGADRNGQLKIFVRFEMYDKDKLELTIGDNGYKGPRDILNQNSESLGLILIKSLVEQINGEIEQLTAYEGIVYRIVFSGKNSE